MDSYKCISLKGNNFETEYVAVVIRKQKETFNNIEYYPYKIQSMTEGMVAKYKLSEVYETIKETFEDVALDY